MEFQEAGNYCGFVIIKMCTTDPIFFFRTALVHIAQHCTSRSGVSIATSCVTIVIVRGFCMTWSINGSREHTITVSDYPSFSWGPPLAHVPAICAQQGRI
jgi:hypothetical protein